MTGITPHTRPHARELRAAMTPQERPLWTRLRDVNRMLRFWNAEVDGNLEGVMQVVLDGLESPPPPSPPHKGEGGQESTPVAPIAGGDLA